EVDGPAVALRLLDQVVVAGLDGPRQRCDLPGGPGGRRVLDRPPGDVHRRRAPVEQLDEVVLEGRPAVPAAAVHLADDDLGLDRAGAQGGDDREPQETAADRWHLSCSSDKCPFVRRAGMDWRPGGTWVQVRALMMSRFPTRAQAKSLA